jgi:hypothetical protein
MWESDGNGFVKHVVQKSGSFCEIRWGGDQPDGDERERGKAIG